MASGCERSHVLVICGPARASISSWESFSMPDQLTLQHPRPTLPPSAVPRPLSPVHERTGSEATALRRALRMTESRFARSLSMSPRTVANWASHPAMVPRSAAQDTLDELLAAASPAVRAKFEQSTAQQPSGSAASAVPAELNARVVSLGSHPRHTAHFRALACVQVSVARTALGMSPDEFGAWLGTVLGWTPCGAWSRRGKAASPLPVTWSWP